MELKEFDRHLSCHDWFYDYSDDISVWRHGKDQQKKLEMHAAESPLHRELMDAYSIYNFSKGIWADKKNTLNIVRERIVPAPVIQEIFP